MNVLLSAGINTQLLSLLLVGFVVMMLGLLLGPFWIALIKKLVLKGDAGDCPTTVVNPFNRKR